MARLAPTGIGVGICSIMLSSLNAAGGGIAIECAVLSSGGTVTADGTRIVIGQAIVGTTFAVDIRLTAGFVSCVEDSGGEPGLPGDLNDDGVVNGADLAIVLGSWGLCAECAADLNGDGSVNGSDLAIVLGNWG